MMLSRVLVIDDQAQVRDTLAGVLRDQGYQVRAVGTGAAALTAAAAEPPDLVVLDLYLPDMNGLQVLGRLLDQHPTLTVLIVSAAPDIRSRVEVLDSGARGFPARPFALAELLARVRSGLRRRPATGPPPSPPGHHPADHHAAGHRGARSSGAAVRSWQRRSVELTGRALDLLRDQPGQDVVDTAVDQAAAAISATEHDPLAAALRALLGEIRRCQHAGQPSSPQLEACFRAAAAAGLPPHS